MSDSLGTVQHWTQNNRLRSSLKSFFRISNVRRLSGTYVGIDHIVDDIISPRCPSPSNQCCNTTQVPSYNQSIYVSIRGAQEPRTSRRRIQRRTCSKILNKTHWSAIRTFNNSTSADLCTRTFRRTPFIHSFNYGLPHLCIPLAVRPSLEAWNFTIPFKDPFRI